MSVIFSPSSKLPKSAILNHKDKRVGIIDLPKFYADFNNKGGRSSFGDVEKEIEKLKKAGIEGLILDLRGNGGGSLHDAVKMAGLFIKSGPVPSEAAFPLFSIQL